MKVYVVAIFIAFILSNCAHTQAEYETYKNTKNIEIKSFKTLKTMSLENRKPLVLSLGEFEKEVIVLNGKRVFATKLQIPQMHGIFNIDVHTSSHVGFYAPKLIFLDRNYKILRTVHAKELFFDRGNFKGTIFINKNYKKMCYLIVTEDLSYYGKKQKLNYVTTSTYAIGYLYYTTASGDLEKTIEYASGGTVSLVLKKYHASILGEEKK